MDRKRIGPIEVLALSPASSAERFDRKVTDQPKTAAVKLHRAKSKEILQYLPRLQDFNSDELELVKNWINNNAGEHEARNAALKQVYI